MDNLKEQDKWQIALDEALIELKKCQQNKTLNSCMECNEILTCKIRKEYVNKVYESMNKGSGGGFEF
jgi:hypothetical protein